MRNSFEVDDVTCEDVVEDKLGDEELVTAHLTSHPTFQLVSLLQNFFLHH
jgi:hypothetical protein